MALLSLTATTKFIVATMRHAIQTYLTAIVFVTVLRIDLVVVCVGR
jgi:hypothetical protein